MTIIVEAVESNFRDSHFLPTNNQGSTMIIKKTKYKKGLIQLYNEFMKYKIYDKNRCTLCKNCIHSKEYTEQTEIFNQLKQRMGSFYQCKNLNSNISNTLRYHCDFFKRK